MKFSSLLIDENLHLVFMLFFALMHDGGAELQKGGLGFFK
jgi:hypothetical protein